MLSARADMSACTPFCSRAIMSGSRSRTSPSAAERLSKRALTAAEFIVDRIGWYEMEDVLGMRIASAARGKRGIPRQLPHQHGFSDFLHRIAKSLTFSSGTIILKGTLVRPGKQ